MNNKKKQPIIIASISAICLIGIIIINFILIYKTFNVNKTINKDIDNNETEEIVKYKKEDVIYDVYDKTDKSISVLTVTYNNNTLTYPFTFNDMLNIGFTTYEDDLKYNVEPKRGKGNLSVEVDNDYKNPISITVYNDSDEVKNVGDCIVNLVISSNDKVTINGITPGVSKYEDVLKKIGKDIEERKNIFYNEKLRQEIEDDSSTMVYYTELATFTRPILKVSFYEDVDTGELNDKVHTVDYRLNNY